MTEAEVEAVARAMARQASIDDGYSDSYALRASLDQGMWRNHEEQARSAIAALDPAREGAGMVTVPLKPTEAMLSAGRETESDCLIWSLEPGEGLDDFDPEPAYRAMLAAASPAPREEVDG